MLFILSVVDVVSSRVSPACVSWSFSGLVLGSYNFTDETALSNSFSTSSPFLFIIESWSSAALMIYSVMCFPIFLKASSISLTSVYFCLAKLSLINSVKFSLKFLKVVISSSVKASVPFFSCKTNKDASILVFNDQTFMC